MDRSCYFFVRHLFVWNACVIAVLRYILPRGLKSARSQKTSRSVEKRATQPPVRSLSFRISVKAASTTSCSILAFKSGRFFPSFTSHSAFKPIKCKPLLKDYGYPLGGKGWEKMAQKNNKKRITYEGFENDGKCVLKLHPRVSSEGYDNQKWVKKMNEHTHTPISSSYCKMLHSNAARCRGSLEVEKISSSSYAQRSVAPQPFAFAFCSPRCERKRN